MRRHDNGWGGAKAAAVVAAAPPAKSLTRATTPKETSSSGTNKARCSRQHHALLQLLHGRAIIVMIAVKGFTGDWILHHTSFRNCGVESHC